MWDCLQIINHGTVYMEKPIWVVLMPTLAARKWKRMVEHGGIVGGAGMERARPRSRPRHIC